MVKYVDRKNTNSNKWDNLLSRYIRNDLLPLWIADMDFAAPQCVIDSLKEYIEKGVFGYYVPNEDYYKSFIEWEKNRHQINIKKEWIRYSAGVVAGINWILQMLTKENDAVMIIVPVYYPFQDAVTNNRRKLVTTSLIHSADTYTIDYSDLEKKIISENVKLLIFCSPHNPVGRVWTKEEIERLLVICKKHNVYVISDEIHHDILMKGIKHYSCIDFTEYDEILITIMAPSKTFNLATFKNSFIIIKDKMLREKYDEYFKKLRISGGASVGYIAAKSAYMGGEKWLNEVLDIIENNYKYVKEELLKHLPKLDITKLEGTYLMWIGLDNYLNENVDMVYVMEKKAGIAIDYGNWFGDIKYKRYIRMNIATKKENIEFAVKQIIEVIDEMN